MLFDIKFITNWESIRLRKEQDVDKIIRRENVHRLDRDYYIGDMVLITTKDIHRKLNCPKKKAIVTKLNIFQLYLHV